MNFCFSFARTVEEPVSWSNPLKTAKPRKKIAENRKTAINFVQTENRNKSPPSQSLVGFRISLLLIFLRLTLFYLPKFFLRIPSSLVSVELIAV